MVTGNTPPQMGRGGSEIHRGGAARQRPPQLDVTGGLVAGAGAGLVMSAWKMGLGALQGAGLWGAPQLIATILLGPGAYDGGHHFRLVPVLVGLALHEATSAAMGLVYVPLARHPILGRRPFATAVAYALASWAIYQYGVMPWLAPVMARHVSAPGMAIAHVVFGLALGGMGVWLARRSRRERGEDRHMVAARAGGAGGAEDRDDDRDE